MGTGGMLVLPVTAAGKAISRLFGGGFIVVLSMPFAVAIAASAATSEFSCDQHSAAPATQMRQTTDLIHGFIGFSAGRFRGAAGGGIGKNEC